MHTRRIQTGLGRAVIVAYFIALLTGIALVHRASAVSGPTNGSPAQWPGSNALTLAADAPTLLIFAHPRCPCTEATLINLRSIAAAERARVVLIISGPAARVQASDDERRLLENARADIVTRDPDGAEAERFGVLTSGHVLVYRQDGTRAFSGGITPMQGHRGACDALERLSRSLKYERVPADKGATMGDLPVYGCPIFSACDSICGAPAGPQICKDAELKQRGPQ